jgi:hypothetical protein
MTWILCGLICVILALVGHISNTVIEIAVKQDKNERLLLQLQARLETTLLAEQEPYAVRLERAYGGPR